MAWLTSPTNLREVCRGPAEAALGEALLRVQVPALALFPEAPLWVPMIAGNVEERMTVDLLVGHGLRAPYRPLFAIECDGYEYHGDYGSFKDDRYRDRRLLLAGLPVLRFASVEVLHHRSTDCLGEVVMAFHLIRLVNLYQDFVLEEGA
ncbi:MAG: hypothetical protein Q8O40_12665 [Chloroflexota bacterium]|nr:hypothetical protein [Chloroflexota bacterium]